MRTAGKFLIFGAVLLRMVVVLSDVPAFDVLIFLLGIYGLLLFMATWLARSRQTQALKFAYLFLQSILVLGLLLISSYEDFLAELFIPISLDAISFFGRRTGFRLILLFSLAMTCILLFSPEGPLFGLAMGVLYSGLNFIFGGYAAQVQKAEAARTRNQRTFAELQEAHRKLWGYADRLFLLAGERERNHLARELHDSVTQTVFSMNLAAQSAGLLWEKDPIQVAGQLSRLEELAVSAQTEIQALVSQLSPSSFKDMELPTALQNLAAEQEDRNDLHVSLEIQGAARLAEATATGLYAIAQEALTNTARHSGVLEAVVRLRLEEGRSCLEVEDRGRGFDLQAAADQRGHLGLVGMSERAREMGWTLSIDSQCDRGTLIRLVENSAGGTK